MTMLHADITQRVIKCFLSVYAELGGGFVESVYRKALLVALLEEGLKARAEVSLKVMFRGQVVGDFKADIIVEDVVILELKAGSQLAGEHLAQLINYLKASGIQVGLLANFGPKGMQHKRAEHPELFQRKDNG